MRDVAVSAAIFLAFVAVLVIVSTVVRRWTRADDKANRPPWTLRELTELRDSGELTIQQYEKLKARAIKEQTASRDRN